MSARTFSQMKYFLIHFWTDSIQRKITQHQVTYGNLAIDKMIFTL